MGDKNQYDTGDTNRFHAVIEELDREIELIDRIQDGDKQAEIELKKIEEKWRKKCPKITLSAINLRTWQKVDALKRAIFQYMKDKPSAIEYGFFEIIESVIYECWFLISKEHLVGKSKERLIECVRLSDECYIAPTNNGKEYAIHFLIDNLRQIN